MRTEAQSTFTGTRRQGGKVNGCDEVLGWAGSPGAPGLTRHVRIELAGGVQDTWGKGVWIGLRRFCVLGHAGPPDLMLAEDVPYGSDTHAGRLLRALSADIEQRLRNGDEVGKFQLELLQWQLLTLVGLAIDDTRHFDCK